MPRVAVAAAAISALIVLGLSAPAQAAITSSNVTAPLNGAHYLITDSSPATTVPVTGTTNGTTGDAVDIRCYERTDRWSSVATNLAVAANGSFSTTMSTQRPYGTCVLRAVPHNWPSGNSTTAFTGPRVTTEWNTSEKVSGGPNDGKVYNLYVLFQSANAMNDYVSATEGGLWDSRVQYADGTSSNYLWYENAALPRNEGGSRSFLQVDGRNAYGPFTAESFFKDNPGLPSLTFSASRDATTGNTTIHETDPIVVCPNETPFPPTAASCPHFNSAGVRLERTIFTTDGGRQVHITDIWRSTDGGAHTVSAHYDQWVEGFQYEPTFGQTQVGLELPWLSSSFQTFTSDVVFPGPASAPASIFVRDQNTAPDGSTAFPRGAVSFDFAPHEVHRASNREFALRDEGIGVPAGGLHMVRQDFVIGVTQAEVSAKAAMNIDRFVPPTVSITAPATGFTSHTQQLMVSGKATDNVGVTSLTVNGAIVAVGSGGDWSKTVPLKVGQGQITAVAKDAAGNSSQAHITVTYPKPELSKLKVAKTTLAKLLRSRKLKLTVAINDVSTVRVSGKLRITGKSKAGFKTAILNFAEPGTKSAKLRLTKAGKRALEHATEATVKITAKATDAGGNKATKKATLKLKH